MTEAAVGLGAGWRALMTLDPFDPWTGGKDPDIILTLNKDMLFSIFRKLPELRAGV